jgi:hypothetical protein
LGTGTISNGTNTFTHSRSGLPLKVQFFAFRGQTEEVFS